jgi:hypothetical protein
MKWNWMNVEQQQQPERLPFSLFSPVFSYRQFFTLHNDDDDDDDGEDMNGQIVMNILLSLFYYALLSTCEPALMFADIRIIINSKAQHTAAALRTRKGREEKIRKIPAMTSVYFIFIIRECGT